MRELAHTIRSSHVYVAHLSMKKVRRHDASALHATTEEKQTTTLLHFCRFTRVQVDLIKLCRLARTQRVSSNFSSLKMENHFRAILLVIKSARYTTQTPWAILVALWTGLKRKRCWICLFLPVCYSISKVYLIWHNISVNLDNSFTESPVLLRSIKYYERNFFEIIHRTADNRTNIYNNLFQCL